MKVYAQVMLSFSLSKKYMRIYGICNIPTVQKTHVLPFIFIKTHEEYIFRLQYQKIIIEVVISGYPHVH